MNTKLQKRLTRWEENWTLAYARWAWIVQRDHQTQPDNATHQVLDLQDKEQYCFEKWMSILTDAAQRGLINQQQADQIIYDTYPRMIENAEKIIQEHSHDAA